MKQQIKHAIQSLCILLLTVAGLQAQENTAQTDLLVGVWEVQGTEMGEGESAWVMPHKHKPDCEKDHTRFEADMTGTDFRYKADCQTNERNFSWTVEGDRLILTSGEQTMEWHLRSLSESSMTVGIPMRPGSENRMYVVYNKQ